MEHVDIAVIGGGPAGAATAIRAARAGAKVVVFEKGPHGRDKVCGDGLTPRAVGALQELEIPYEDEAHRIDRGLGGSTLTSAQTTGRPVSRAHASNRS